MLSKTKKYHAQSIIEYSVLLGVVAAAVMAMTVYLNRSVKGKMKHIESQLNEPIILMK
ncbi:MAG: hypothetical protein NC936_03180 [Candidatus Omnitrophica bacterium]|nr:hypothetical protein [Candidatus Omnitrophota bacterium]